MHDPRLGRFFAVDPLTAKYPYYTPYQFSGNKVIQFVELEGLETETPPIQEESNINIDEYESSSPNNEHYTNEELLNRNLGNSNISNYEEQRTTAVDNTRVNLPVLYIEENTQSFSTSATSIDATVSGLSSGSVGMTRIPIPIKNDVWELGNIVEIPQAIHGVEIAKPGASVDLHPFGSASFNDISNSSVTETIKKSNTISNEVQVISPYWIGVSATEVSCDAFTYTTFGVSVGTPGGSVSSYNSKASVIEVTTAYKIDSTTVHYMMLDINPDNPEALEYQFKHNLPPEHGLLSLPYGINNDDDD